MQTESLQEKKMAVQESIDITGSEAVLKALIAENALY